jgi:hypothetical protein
MCFIEKLWPGVNVELASAHADASPAPPRTMVGATATMLDKQGELGPESTSQSDSSLED